MALVVLSIDETKLPTHTREQFQEWVEFSVGHRAGISESNPLHVHDMEATVREVSSR